MKTVHRRFRREVTFPIVLILVLAVSGGTGWASLTAARTEKRPPICGPRDSRSLSESRSVRIYSNDDEGPSKARVCSVSVAGSVKLGEGPVSAPFSISAPWAAATESRGSGQDTAVVRVVEANSITRATVSCLVGSANRPEQIPRVREVWATPDGTLVVSAEVRLPHPSPELALCSSAGMEVVASGPTFTPGSIEVKGSLLSWTQSGQPRRKRV